MVWTSKSGSTNSMLGSRLRTVIISSTVLPAGTFMMRTSIFGITPFSSNFSWAMVECMAWAGVPGLNFIKIVSSEYVPLICSLVPGPLLLDCANTIKKPDVNNPISINAITIIQTELNNKTFLIFTTPYYNSTLLIVGYHCSPNSALSFFNVASIFNFNSASVSFNPFSFKTKTI